MSNGKLKSAPSVIRGRSGDGLVETLRNQIAAIEGPRRQAKGVTVSSGTLALDRLLPGGGFRWGTLVEWLAAEPGSGAGTLALYAARQACREAGVLVVLDWAGEFYPPAAAGLGIELAGMIVVQAATEAEDTWALDQALRCPGVRAVLAYPDRLDDRTFRRLQLAAEAGGGLGLLVRPQTAEQQPSWADVRLLVQPRPGTAARRRLKIRVLHSRGAADTGSVEVEIDDETRTVHLASRLAHSTAHRRAAGA